ncbi:hypothetical protein AYO37_00530 [Opitutia bacterium SCGC AG-212-L18]|nr:hypothetical protein AYO37_00530 [Opitutae bacterium SCGC AG-212-L18]
MAPGESILNSDLNIYCLLVLRNYFIIHGNMFYVTLIWIPVVTGLIGWATNWVAIKMLFKPRKSYCFIGLKIQGLIPKRQKRIANIMGEIIERDLLSSHTIRRELQQIDIEPYLSEVTRRLVHEGLGKKLQAMPLIGGFINASALEKLEKMALESIAGEAGSLMETLSLEMEKRIHVKRIIEEKINEFDLDKLESMVMEAANKEFKMIEWIGGILGFIIGLGQVLILWLTGELNF